MVGEEVLDIGSISYLDIIGGNQTGYHRSILFVEEELHQLVLHRSKLDGLSVFLIVPIRVPVGSQISSE